MFTILAQICYKTLMCKDLDALPCELCPRRQLGACTYICLLHLLQIFGKTLVCKDLDVATRVSSAHGINCVTMDGDQRDKKGTFTGGFIDTSRSRIAAMSAIKVRWNSDTSFPPYRHFAGKGC